MSAGASNGMHNNSALDNAHAIVDSIPFFGLSTRASVLKGGLDQYGHLQRLYSVTYRCACELGTHNKQSLLYSLPTTLKYVKSTPSPNRDSGEVASPCIEMTTKLNSTKISRERANSSSKINSACS